MPYKGKKINKARDIPDELLSINPYNPDSMDDLYGREWLIGRLEQRVSPGFAARGQFLLIDKNADVLYPICQVLGLDPRARVVSFADQNGKTYWGVHMTKEEEIELWLKTYWDYRSIYFKHKIEKWMGSVPIEIPDRSPYLDY